MIVDFVTWPADPAFVEFNIFKYTRKPGGGLVAQQYALRDYQDTTGFLRSLGPGNTSADTGLALLPSDPKGGRASRSQAVAGQFCLRKKGRHGVFGLAWRSVWAARAPGSHFLWESVHDSPWHDSRIVPAAVWPAHPGLRHATVEPGPGLDRFPSLLAGRPLVCRLVDDVVVVLPVVTYLLLAWESAGVLIAIAGIVGIATVAFQSSGHDRQNHGGARSLARYR